MRQIEADIQATLLNLKRAEDYLLPDLRLFSRYGINGVNTTLGGSLSNVVSKNAFSNWDLGVQLEVPIGMRAGHAEVTRAKLLLAQCYGFLREQEGKLVMSLQRSYRDLIQFREEILTRRSVREAVALQVKGRYEKFKGGKESIDLLVRTQRNWADALRDEYAVVCRYNIALADFERQKGTILTYHNVTIADGGVPTMAHNHASQCFAQHTQQEVAEARRYTPAAATWQRDPGAPAQPSAILEYLDPGQQPPARLENTTASASGTAP